MDYALGDEIHKVEFERYPIEILRIALLRLKYNTGILSDLGIKIDEYYRKNILFDGTNFTLVDTQGYDYNFGDTHLSNLIGIMRELFIYIFGGDPLVHEYVRGVAGGLFIYDNDLLTHPELLIDKLEEDYYKKTKEYMNTLGDTRILLK